MDKWQIRNGERKREREREMKRLRFNNINAKLKKVQKMRKNVEA